MTELTDIQLNVLLVSRRKDALDVLETALRSYTRLRVQRKLIVNGHVDPLHEVDTLPDALVLHLGENSHAELEAVAARPADRRPPLIVVGSGGNTTVMRLAMHAGARDLLPLPLIEADFVAALERIARDKRASESRANGNLIAFMNAKGGSGATFLACNAAHMLTTIARRQVALLDLDLQFGTIPLYFDLFPKRGVLQALENSDGLDETAFDGYLVRHSSGLKILGHAAEDSLSTQAASVQQMRHLLKLAVNNNDHVVIDLPRRIDALTTLAIEHAQHIVVVVQQSVATLRDATRLINCLRRELGVGRDRIVTVVNRYQKNARITTEDIRTTLACTDLVLIPSDFATVSACLDTGAPLLDCAPTAPITRAVEALQIRLGGASSERQSFLARNFSGFMKSRLS